MTWSRARVKRFLQGRVVALMHQEELAVGRLLIQQLIERRTPDLERDGLACQACGRAGLSCSEAASSRHQQAGDAPVAQNHSLAHADRLLDPDGSMVADPCAYPGRFWVAG